MTMTQAPKIQPLQRLGLMGGTFDPIHYGHLALAEGARLRFGLERVLFIPAGRPPHKRDQHPNEAQHRAAMVELAIADNPAFALSRAELERQGYSYSIDTVRQLQQAYGPETQIFFITGADAILELDTWYQAEQLVQCCTFVAGTRPGFDLAGLDKLPAEWRQQIHCFSLPALAISASELRRRAAAGESLRYLLPDQVLAYIRRHGLYRRRESEAQP